MFCTAKSCGFRQCWSVYVDVGNRTFYLELEDLETAVSSASCYLGELGLELAALQFSYL